MEKLYKDVEIEIENELQRAAVKFGDKNNSPHEAYAVIREEVEEAMEEVRELTFHLKDYWQGVKNNEREEQNKSLDDLKKRAHLAACEMIQVAAMAQKALNGYMRDEQA